MTFNQLNGSAMGSNVNYIFIYANEVTGGLFVPMTVLSFFLVVLISSLIMQLRFTSRIRPEVSFLASSFATFGFAIIFEQMTGLLAPIYFIVTIGLTILGFIWVAMTE